MAISPKGKRKIVVDDRTYFWWVYEEYDQTAFDGFQVKIVDEKQIGYFKYGLQQTDKGRKVVISLKDQQLLIQVSCPPFENDEGIITPAGIERLIS